MRLHDVEFKINTKLVYLAITINILLGFVTLVEGGTLLGCPKVFLLGIQVVLFIVNVSSIIQGSRVIEDLAYHPLTLHLGLNGVKDTIRNEKGVIIIHELMLVIIPALITFL